MKIELENRLIEFVMATSQVCDNLNRKFIAQHLSTQLIRSSTSCALNYGEAQSAESKKDFIHKISIIGKELRESRINLKIINGMNLCKNQKIVHDLLKENNELLAIFYATIQTAKRNQNRKS